MEHITILIGRGTRARLERIKALRRLRSPFELSDEELITAAIACYWAALERRNDTD